MGAKWVRLDPEPALGRSLGHAAAPDSWGRGALPLG